MVWLHRPMSLPEVLQLPEVCVEAGSRLEGDSCPVCLESYRVGDKVGFSISTLRYLIFDIWIFLFVPDQGLLLLR